MLLIITSLAHSRILLMMIVGCEGGIVLVIDENECSSKSDGIEERDARDELRPG